MFYLFLMHFPSFYNPLLLSYLFIYYLLLNNLIRIKYGLPWVYYLIYRVFIFKWAVLLILLLLEWRTQLKMHIRTSIIFYVDWTGINRKKFSFAQFTKIYICLGFTLKSKYYVISGQTNADRSVKIFRENQDIWILNMFSFKITFDCD